MINVKRSKGDKAFDAINVIVMLVVSFATLYPMWYALVLSLNDGTDAMSGGIYWWPRIFSLVNYRAVFSNSGIINAYAVSILRVILGTVTNVFFTAMVAYAYSKKRLIGRNIYMTMGTISLFFGGGLIPYFLLIKGLGMYNSFLVYIIPVMFNFYNLLIFQSFFRGIPESIEESAKIDGAGDFYIFLRFIIPLSKPVLATIALFMGVYCWNDYFMGVIFISKPNLQPIQTYLFKVIAESSAATNMITNAPMNLVRKITSESVKYATMMVTTIPIICVYPFLQKYFVKGMLIGSIKG